MGPTATGKTDAAAQLSETIDAEIISVDSSLVYRGMNIGTAKPDADFLARYPHHLVDVRDPNDTYSVADFYADCSLLIQQITERGRVPILAGGTMFYFNALERGLTELPQADAALRAEIDAQAKVSGWPMMHAKLVELDSVSAARIDPHDAQRIQRALEIVIQSGITVEAHNARRKPPVPNRLIKIALSFTERSVLHDRIRQRFEIMLEQGLQAEVEDLLNAGVHRDTPAMRMIGYRQMLEFLEGDLTNKEMCEKGVVATRQLAKRQLTWLRNQNNVLWWTDLGLKDKQFQPLVDLVQSIVRL
jgi:tRNA dimethylallyltransferase